VRLSKTLWATPFGLLLLAYEADIAHARSIENRQAINLKNSSKGQIHDAEKQVCKPVVNETLSP
jgi:hypothetical protein